MVLWAILAVALFTYIAIELGETMKHNPFYIVMLFAGYAIIIILLSMVFAHRFLGPFERLKTELRIILSGDYQRKLRVRSRDDFYIRSFILEVNKLVEAFERTYLSKQDFRAKINYEISKIQPVIEREDISKEELKDAIISFKEKLKSLLKDNKE